MEAIITQQLFIIHTSCGYWEKVYGDEDRAIDRLQELGKEPAKKIPSKVDNLRFYGSGKYWFMCMAQKQWVKLEETRGIYIQSSKEVRRPEMIKELMGALNGL